MTEQPIELFTENTVPENRLHPGFVMARLYLTITFPILLVLLSTRLVMSPAFLYLEYTRPGFPVDRYGLTTEDRLYYGPYAVNYLLNDAGIEYLANLTFPDGTRLFNSRELRHMFDVKLLTQTAFATAIVAGFTFAVLVLLLARRADTRIVVKRALRDGSLLTLTVIGVILLVAVIGWEFFFTTFHELFFESGTWYFAYSDTLIRLFPEQFWFDAAIVIGALTALTAAVTTVLTWRWQPKGEAAR
jgi:integral membrane protein (TIGR01906 family)